MRRLLLLALVLAAVAGAVAGPAVAQDGTANVSTTATATTTAPTTTTAKPTTSSMTAPTSTATPTATPTEDQPENQTRDVSIELSPVAEITQWEYRDGQFHVTIRAQTPTRVSVADSAALFRSLSEGSGARAVTIPTEGYTLAPGKTTIHFDAATYEDIAAISVAGQQRTVLLRTDSLEDEGFGETDWSMVYIAAVVAFTGGVGSVWWTAKHADRDDSPTVDRRL